MRNKLIVLLFIATSLFAQKIIEPKTVKDTEQNLELNLKLELSIDKNEYIIGEPILAKLKIINISSHDIKIENLGKNQAHSKLGLFPIITGKYNQQGVYDVRITNHWRYNGYILPAGDTAYYFLDLIKEYQNCFRKSIVKWKFNHFLELDKYKFQYELINGIEKNVYISNTTKFSVIKPGKKEKTIYFEYLNSRYNAIQLENILKKYPNSKYNTYIFNSFLYHTSLKNENLRKVYDNYLIADTTGRLLEYLLLFNGFRFSSSERERISNEPKFQKLLKKRNILRELKRKNNFRRKRKIYGKKYCREKRNTN